MKHFYFLGILLFIHFYSKAALTLYGLQAGQVVRGAQQVITNDHSTIPSFILFEEGKQPDFDNPDLWLRMNFGLSSEFSLVLKTTETDKLGFIHYRYIQLYNGNTIDGTMWIIHVRNGKVVSMNGFLKDQLKITGNSTLSEQDALNKALLFTHASVYKWQLSSEEALLKKMLNDPNATYLPKGKLICVFDSRIENNFAYKLAWQFDIYADQPMSRKLVSIDASNGDVVDVKERIQEANSNGTAVTGYSGTQPIVTDSVNASTFRLRENGRGAGLGMETYNLQTGTSFGNAVDFTDADNFWNNVNGNKDQYATDAHFAAEKTYDYYYSKYGRNSINNAGLKLVSYVHYSANYVNAFWDGSRMTYGDGSGSITPLTSLDIGGHEITHGLTEYTAGLNYSYESGALNESFSDCFGTSVEWYADPVHADWLIGEDIGSPFRSHSNPNAYNDPDTYHGLYWNYGSSDNGGVHTNSNVQNYWFYILSVGGSGTNDIGNSFSVTGIGIDKAAAIAFRTLTVYLTATSQYIDARNYSIQAAIDLYGSCSAEMIATINAWYAVGVGNATSVPTTIYHAGPPTVCNGETVVLNAIAPFGATYDWYKDGNLISGASASSYIATTSGTYHVITNSCGDIYTSNSIDVNVITLSPTILPSGSVTACDNQLLSVDNTSGYNLQWKRNGIPITGATNSTYNTSLGGDYSVTLSATINPSQTFSNTSVVNIPDNSCTGASSTINVGGFPNSINTAGVSITINMTHPWDGDLQFMLEAPNGDLLGLSNMAGSSGDNFINTTFSDNGAGPISTAIAPFTGTFKPWPTVFVSCINTTKTSFASIGDGVIDPNGNWTFRVYDRGGQDLGTIDSWSITFPPIAQPYPNCGPVTSPATTVSIGSIASITFNSSSIRNYQVNQKNDFTGNARAYGAAVTINGKGYYGFGDNGFKNDWWEYNSTTDTWTQKSNCPQGRQAAGAFAIGTKAYIVGGNNGSYLNSVYEWNSVSNTWTLKNVFPGGARGYVSSCSVGGKGYIICGRNNTILFQDIWEYDASTDQWTFKTNVLGAINGRMKMSSFVLGSKIFFGVGQTCVSSCSSISYVNDWFEYDVFSNIVSQKNNFPGQGRESANGFTIDDYGYLIFGYNAGAYLTDYWEYDSQQDTWNQKGNSSALGKYAAASTVIKGKAYTFGGNDINGLSNNVFEFKVTSNICSNNPSSIVLNSSAGNNYTWNTGAVTQSITGVSSGDYSVLVNNSGCSSNAYKSISIYPVPVASISAGGPLTFCSGGSVNLTSTAANSYLWSNGATTNSIAANTSANYTVTVTGSGGCTSTSLPTTVIAYPGPPVTIIGSSSLSICQGSSVTLNAYGYLSIPFAPISGTGTQVSLSDDQLSGILPIGFNFTFFNNTYSSFYISSNGFITFGTSPNGCCAGQVLPNISTPNNLISFAWNDLYPPAGGYIEYFTTGNAPNRKLIVNFNAIQHWPNGNPVTAQVILFETSNLIEIHTTSMTTNGTAHTMGIENIGGTQAVIIPSRNGSSWSATNDAIRFSSRISSYLWSNNATTQSTSVSTAGAFTVAVTDQNNCSATSTPVAVGVMPLPNAVITPGGPTTFCLGDSVTLTANSANAYLWSNGSTTQNIQAKNTGNYTVTVTGVNNCTKTSNPTSVTADPCNAPVILKVFIQGFYKGGGVMEAVLDKSNRPSVCDSVTLELHNPTSPYGLAYKEKGVIDINGNGNFVFPLAALNNTYYLVVVHRNVLQTWSSNAVTLVSPTTNYDFTNAANKSFGSNAASLGGGLFGIYSGDVNNDNAINTTDFSLVETGAISFQAGYLNADLSGDWIIEDADYSLIENNIRLSLVVLKP